MAMTVEELDDSGIASRDTSVRIDDVLVEKENAPRQYRLADRPGLVGAMDAVERVFPP